MRDCNKCVHARPYGGENDNRCSAWACEFIDRDEAIKAWREKQKTNYNCEDCKHYNGNDGCDLAGTECRFEPQAESEMEHLERIDNEIEDAWAKIRELTDEPQIDCPWQKGE